MATDTRTGLGKIYRGCKCPLHQEIYSDWLTHNAELIIAQCIKIEPITPTVEFFIDLTSIVG
jgi:hypothetical protein